MGKWENKEELMMIGENIRNSDLKKSGRFSSLIRNLSTMSTEEIYETIVELCLQYNIDCQELIDKRIDVKESKLSEDDFRHMLYAVMM